MQSQFTHVSLYVEPFKFSVSMLMINSTNMELISPSMLISLLALVISLPLVFFLSKNKSHSSMLLPGTYGWPIIGETFEFFKENFVADRMEKYSSQVFKTSVIGESVAVFCGPAGNKCLFSNENKLVTSWWPNQLKKVFVFSTKTSNEEESIIAHQTLPGFYKGETLQRFVGIMDSVAKHHLKASWENRKEVHVLPLSKSFTFYLGCKLFVSLDDPIHLAKLHNPFVELTSGHMSIPINFPGTPFNKAIKAANHIRKELVQIIKQRKVELAEGKASPTQDTLSQMLCGGHDGGWSTVESDIANRILGLMVGGHTASIVITSFIKYLAELPHVYNQVLKEQREILEAKPPGEPLKWEDLQKMRYSWNVIREAMRLTPPVAGTFREAITDFTHEGFSIPKGWKVYWSTHSTHRNADYFPDPEKFDPSRFEGNGPAPYTFVPFGGGPRMCPGKEYARLTMLVFMHNLVTKFKWEKIFPNEEIVLNPTKMPEPVKGLPIRLEPHVC